MPPHATEQALAIFLTLYIPLALGYTLRKLRLLGTEWTRPCMVWLMILVEPPITAYSLWRMDHHSVAVNGNFHAGIASIILAASLITTAMIFAGRIASEFFCHDAATRGAFIGVSMFSNNGFTLGVFVCFLFLGVRGQSLGVTYATYFLPYFVTIGFAIGHRYGIAKRRPVKEQFLSIFTQPLSALPLAGLVTGLALNRFAPPAPDWILPINRAVIHAEVAIYAFAIGCTLSLASVRRYWRECVAVCGMKFLVTPLVGFGVVLVLRSLGVLGTEPIVSKTIFVQSCMPAAIMSVVLAKLFCLNEDLAAACWAVSTLASAAVLPLVYLAVQ